MMDSPLPVDIQRLIIANADLSIDTKLYFQKTLEMKPNKIVIPHDLRDKLSKLCSDRVIWYNLNPNYPGGLIYHVIAESEKVIEIVIQVSEHANIAKMRISIIKNNPQGYRYVLRTSIVNMYNGVIERRFVYE